MSVSHHYLLSLQEDCSNQDSPPDEVAQRSADLDDLEDLDDLNIELNNQEEDAAAAVDGLVPAPLYLSPSKSHSRLSRMDTHRVRDATSCLCYDQSSPVVSVVSESYCLFS